MQVWGPYVVVGVVGLAILAFFLIGSSVARRRENRFTSERSTDTEESFVNSFRPKVRPIARAIHLEFQSLAFVEKFPFRKSDRVDEILGVDKVDLDDLLQRVAKQFGARKPNKRDYEKFSKRETLEDFVEFISYLRATDSVNQG